MPDVKSGNQVPSTSRPRRALRHAQGGVSLSNPAWRFWLIAVVGLPLVLVLLWRLRDGQAENRQGASPPTTISVDELRAGQRGFGWTTLRGSEPIRFGVEVLGIMRNARPQQDMVLVRLEGEPLAETGVALGMSGSPVYIDGRLAGAIAYTWTYAKEPIAGVTPIANMLQLLQPAEGPEPPEPQTVSGREGMSLVPFFLSRRPGPDATAELPPLLPASPLPAEATPAALTPLRPAVSIGGLPPAGEQVLVTSFEGAGFLAVAGSSSGSAGAPTADASTDALKPGAPLVVELARGDLEISALGSVTAVLGDQLIGFGHPLLGEPGAELPVATGFIEATIPRQQVSLKLWSPLQEVGVTEVDGLAGLTGRLGRRATMIPVELVLRRPDVGRDDTYRFELARHPTLTPNLLGTIAAAALSVGGMPPPDSSAHLVTTFQAAGHAPFCFDDWYSGPGLAAQLAQEIAIVPQLLMDNPFGPVELERVTIFAEVVKGRRTATIESLTLREVTVRPGDTVEAEVVVAPYQEPRQRLTVRLKVPADDPPGPRIFVAGDARSEARLDVMARRHHYEPRTLDELMSLLREEFKQVRLYARLSRGQYGVAIQGAELPALPPSVMQILSSPLETDRSAIVGSVGTSLETAWVLQGVKAAYLKVIDEQERNADE